MADVWGLLDFSFTNKGLFEGERLMRNLGDLVGEARIEDLAIPFTAVASDIEWRREVWLARGSLFEAIRASIATPGFFTPVERDGRVLVDGGLLSPLPLATAQRHVGERTIVVSLNGNSERFARGQADDDTDGGDETPRERGNPFQHWYQAARDKLGLDADQVPTDNAFDTMTKSVAAMQDRIARFQIAAYCTDILIEVAGELFQAWQGLSAQIFCKRCHFPDIVRHSRCWSR
jgi:NTE family protein